jgi:hypothetical protein
MLAIDKARPAESVFSILFLHGLTLLQAIVNPKDSLPR